MAPQKLSMKFIQFSFSQKPFSYLGTAISYEVFQKTSNLRVMPTDYEQVNVNGKPFKSSVPMIYRNKSIDLQRKSIDWDLCNGNIGFKQANNVACFLDASKIGRRQN